MSYSSANLLAEMHFAEFYRTRLRREIGMRVRSAELMAAYTVWARAGSGQSRGFRQLRRFMIRRGHGHFYSDGARYSDLVILPARDALERASDRQRDAMSCALELVARIDAMRCELDQVRAILIEAGERSSADPMSC